MTQHTAKNWRFEPHGPESHFYGNITGSYGIGDFGIEEVRTIACLTKFGPREEYETHARLIAAAPELLEAAQSAIALLTYEGEDATGFAAKIEADLRAAIAKATGTS